MDNVEFETISQTESCQTGCTETRSNGDGRQRRRRGDRSKGDSGGNQASSNGNGRVRREAIVPVGEPQLLSNQGQNIIATDTETTTTNVVIQPASAAPIVHYDNDNDFKI